jgi:hypothetical protein
MGRRKRFMTAEQMDKEPGRIHAERVEAARRRRQRLLVTWCIVIAALFILVVVVWQLWPRPAVYAQFAQCLRASGATLYGSDTCSHCIEQKGLFGAAFKDVAWVSCDYTRSCEEQNITLYPTWVFADGSRLVGGQTLDTLSERTGCPLPAYR